MTTIDEQAALWRARADAGRLPPDEQQQLDAWLGADPRHLGAWVRLGARWQDLDRLVALNAGQAMAPAPRFALFSRRAAIAASLGGVGAAALGWSLLSPAGELYSTTVGEVRRIPLADSSTLILNTNSAVRVHLRRRSRDVQLLSGEALFEVAPDPQRPFVVRANQWQVRAVGTVFGVRLRGAEVDVTVTEGAVDLDRGGAGVTPAARRLSANEESILQPAAAVRIDQLAPRHVERRFAWTNGMVVFSGESLREAAAEVNRHNRRQLVIDDAALAAQPVVGAFRATDLDGFAAAAAAALDADTFSIADRVHLRPRRRVGDQATSSIITP